MYLESTFGVQTKIICVDFSNDDIYEDIKQELNELDIGILGNKFLSLFVIISNHNSKQLSWNK